MAEPFNDVSSSLMADYEELLRGYYSELRPDADVSTGSVLYELVIRPAAYIYARNEVALEALRTQYSLKLLSETPNPDSTLAENLAANFRVERRSGTPGSGSIAVYTTQTNDVYFPEGTTMVAGDVTVEVLKTYVGTMDDEGLEDTDTLSYKKFIKTGPDEYAFMIPVSTVDPTSTVVAEGVPAVLTGSNPQVSRMVVASAISGGSDEETTADLVDRAMHGVTAKIPSGKAHIEALLKEQTKVIVRDLAVVGMGDAEMLRDKNNVFLLSTGSRVDVYTRTSQLPATLTIQKKATRLTSTTWSMFFERDEAPGWYYIAKIAHATNPKEITNQEELNIEFLYQQVPNGPEVFSGVTARYSPYQTARVEFSYPALPEGDDEFLVSLVYMPQLDDLQEMITAPSIRNKQQDNLIKGAVPAYTGLDLTIKATADTSDIDLSEVQNTLATFINKLPIGRGFLSVSDLAVCLNTAYPALTLSFPAKLSLVTYLPDATTQHVTTTEGVIYMYEDTSQGVSATNTAFFCRAEDITINIEV